MHTLFMFYREAVLLEVYLNKKTHECKKEIIGVRTNTVESMLAKPTISTERHST